MANERRQINLLPGSKDENLLTQILNWALTIGRLLVILVEMLALGTFLYRFGLDMNIVDLHDKIKAKSAIVQNFSSQETNFRNLQARLALAKTYGDANPVIPTLKDITEMGKGKVTFSNIQVELGSAKIEASAPTSNALSQFINLLKSHPSVTEVGIDKIENQTKSAKIVVILSVKLKTIPSLMTQEPKTKAPAVQSDAQQTQ